MKKKLTITLDEDLIPSMKENADSEGTSLSALIEDLLKQHMRKKTGELFSQKWRGSFLLVSDKSPRRSFLSKRYSG